MTLLLRVNAQELLEDSGKPCVSLYLPCDWENHNATQTVARYRHLLDCAEERLAEHSWIQPDIREQMQAARAIDPSYFWRYQQGSIAVFISPDRLQCHHVPLQVNDQVVVADRFYLSPVMPLLAGDGRFLVLAFSQNRVRLFFCSDEYITDVELEDVPDALQVALHYDAYDNQQDIPLGSAIATLPRQHKHVPRQTYSAIQTYCQQLDAGICRLLWGDRAPLILAGVQHVTSIYRRINTYPNLLDQEITSNPDVMKPQLLHQQARTIAHSHFQQVRQVAAERYRELAVSEQASGKLHDIIPAAYRGQIDTLFIANSANQWGKFDEQSQVVKLYSTPKAESIDLIEFAALHTILGGGTVYSIPAQRMPEHTSLAAIFRYPISAMQSNYRSMI